MAGHESYTCPVCGEDNRVRALACDGCGADERTGYTEKESGESYRSSGLDLPDGDDFDYEGFVESEFGESRGTTLNWGRFLVVMLLILAFVAYFGR